MMYIKLFENFDGEFYIEIGSQEAFDRFRNDGIEIDVDDEVKIRNLIGNDYKIEKCKTPINQYLFIKKINEVSNSFGIYKLEDEWWVVGRHLKSLGKYYLCDQMDGLETLIKKLLK